MELDYIILLLVVGLALYIILRISSLSHWMRTNVDMRKGANRLDPQGSFKRYEMDQRQELSTKQHRIALRRARSDLPGKRK